MELDELKSAWSRLDRRLERQDALLARLVLDRRLDRVRSHLRPLVVGQLLQIAFGVAFVVLGAGFWTRHRDTPHLLLAGLGLHLYGVVAIVLGGVTVALIARIDYAAPVLAIQKQLARLRAFYLRNAVLAGLAWWVLWVPLLMVGLLDLFAADVYANAPSVVVGGLASGVLGLFGCGFAYRLARNGRHPRLAKALDESMTGRSLVAARAVLADVAGFEREG
jgi:hypothetical protein